MTTPTQPEQKPAPVEQRHREIIQQALAHYLRSGIVDRKLNEQSAAQVIADSEARAVMEATSFLRKRLAASAIERAEFYSDLEKEREATKDLRAQLEAVQLINKAWDLANQVSIQARYKLRTQLESQIEETGLGVETNNHLLAQLKQTESSYEKCHEEVSRQVVENDQLRGQLADLEYQHETRLAAFEEYKKLQDGHLEAMKAKYEPESDGMS